MQLACSGSVGQSFERLLVESSQEIFGDDMTQRLGRGARRMFSRSTGRILRFMWLVEHPDAAPAEPGSPTQWNVMAALHAALCRARIAVALELGRRLAHLDPAPTPCPTLHVVEPPPEAPLCRHAPPASGSPVPVRWEVRAA